MQWKTLREHTKEVDALQRQLQTSSGLVALQRSSTCCSRSFEYKKNKLLLDVSKLNGILELNCEERYILIEPSLSMEELLRATLPVNLTLPVITEFRHMSIGGAIQGLAGESSSFRYGFLDESVMECEILLGNGEKILVSKREHSDLFYALPGSYGSLGLMTAIKLKLIPTLPFVKVVYEKVHAIDAVIKEFNQSPKQTYDFIECVAISANDFRIAKGYRVAEPTRWEKWSKTTSLKSSWSVWYYNHLKTISQQSSNYEYLSYEDYIFRWDRGGFWIASVHLRHNLFNRLVFGSKLNCKNLYKYLYRKKSLYERDSVWIAQDLMLPIDALEDFLIFLNQTANIYPLWFIPLKAPAEQYLFSLPSCDGKLYVDVGIWGAPKQKPFHFLEVNRAIESKLREINGRKWLWAQAFYDQSEFWSIYNKDQYKKLRDNYHATNRFIDIHQKVTELYQAMSL